MAKKIEPRAGRHCGDRTAGGVCVELCRRFGRVRRLLCYFRLGARQSVHDEPHNSPSFSAIFSV
ncbi:MAG: hypothetical protein LBT21_06640 [Oscillospiraceae bacterium]|nr:hypothetical protein [Oscillospiraceae bacterium]